MSASDEEFEEEEEVHVVPQYRRPDDMPGISPNNEAAELGVKRSRSPSMIKQEYQTHPPQGDEQHTNGLGATSPPPKRHKSEDDRDNTHSDMWGNVGGFGLGFVSASTASSSSGGHGHGFGEKADVGTGVGLGGGGGLGWVKHESDWSGEETKGGLGMSKDTNDYDENVKIKSEAEATNPGTGLKSEIESSEGSDGLNYALRLMKNMGYREGQGLGASGTGVTGPLPVENRQITRAGIGMETGVSTVDMAHTYEEVDYSIKMPLNYVSLKDPDTLPKLPRFTPVSEDRAHEAKPSALGPRLDIPGMHPWLTFGPATMQYMAGDGRFCRPDLERGVFEAKDRFNYVESRQFKAARDKANPFEKLKAEMFQNRAALKMAEMDSQCGRAFTQPECLAKPAEPHPAYIEYADLPADGMFLKKRSAPTRELLYFGDVCAGPGGFTEYMLTILKSRSMGFGFTLKGRDDFKPEKFNVCAPPHSFKAYYGPKGDGDVTKEENLRAYADTVWRETRGRGLHVLLADGGFSVEGKENYQEVLSRQLILCQCIAALSTLRKGGVFVCKLFDNFLRFTVDCLYLLRLAFTHVALIKPNQSRPANSERYIFCKGLRERGGIDTPLVQYMLHVNALMNRMDSLEAQRQQLIRLGLDLQARRDRVEGTQENMLGFVQAGTLQDGTGENGGLGHDNGDGKDGSDGDKDDGSGQGGNKINALGGMKHPERETVISLVPDHLMDDDFLHYVKDFNDKYAQIQTRALNRILKYLEDPNLPTDDQDSIRLQCLKEWGIADNLLKPSGPPQYYVPYDPEWGMKHFSAIEVDKGYGERVSVEEILLGSKAQESDDAGRARYDASCRLINSIRTQIGGMYFIINTPMLAREEGETDALALNGQLSTKLTRAVRKKLEMVVQHQKLTNRGWYCVAVPQGKEMKREIVLTLPKQRNKTYTLAQPDETEEARMLSFAQVRATRFGELKHRLDAPGDAVLDCFVRDKDVVYAFDAWSLPFNPNDLKMGEVRPSCRDRSELLSLFIDAMRDDVRLKYLPVISLFDLFTSHSPTRGVGLRKIWTPGHDLYIFFGDSKRPAPGVLIRVTEMDVVADSLSAAGGLSETKAAFDRDVAAVLNALKIVFPDPPPKS